VTHSSHALSTLWSMLCSKVAAVAVAVAAVGGAIYGVNAYNKQCKYIASDLSKDLYSGCKWLYKITNQYELITNKLAAMQCTLSISELTLWEVRVSSYLKAYEYVCLRVHAQSMLLCVSVMKELYKQQC
jgi:hypothetical protein